MKLAIFRNLEFVILGGVFLALSLSFSYNYCHRAMNWGFDRQNFLSWEYMAVENKIPYRDYLTIYGLADYYKTINIWFYSLYVFLTPILFLCIYSLYRKAYSRLFALLSISILFWITYAIVGLQSWLRYGLIPVVSLLALLVVRLHKWWLYPLYGVFVGLLISGWIDLGLPLLLISVSLIFVLTELGVNFKKEPVRFRLRNDLLFVGGICMGLIPFVWWLSRHQLWLDWWRVIQSLSALTESVKVPFSLFADRFQLPIFVLLSLSLLLLSYGWRHKQQTLLSWQILGVLVMSGLVLYEKNIVRSQYDVMAMMSGFLVIGLIGYAKSALKSINHNYPFFIFIFIIVSLYLIGTLGFVSNNQVYENDLLSVITKSKLFLSHPIIYFKSRTCEFGDFYRLSRNQTADIHEVFVTLQKDYPSHPSLISFPYKPFIGVLFDTTPLPSLNTFNSADRISQQMSINYLHDNPIQIMLYNISQGPIDNVPDYIRSPQLLQYLLKNYLVVKQIKNYYVFEKRPILSAEQIITAISSYPELYDYLTHLELGNIPRLENKKLTQFDDRDKEIILKSETIEKVNAYLVANRLTTTGLFIQVVPKVTVGKFADVEMGLNFDSLDRSWLILRNCSPTGCLVDVETLPLGALERQLTRVDSATGSANLITLLRLKNKENYW